MRLLLGTLTLLLAACSSAPGSVTQEEQAAPPPRSPSTSRPAEPAGDPLTFGSSGGSVTVHCFPDDRRRMVIFDHVTTDRPVSLRGLDTSGDALRVTSSWVRRLDRREVAESGIIDLRPGRTVPDRWPGARPLDGRALRPDERYSFYVLAEVRPDARFDDVTLRWADEATSGSSSYPFQGRTRSGGC